MFQKIFWENFLLEQVASDHALREVYPQKFHQKQAMSTYAKPWLHFPGTSNFALYTKCQSGLVIFRDASKEVLGYLHANKDAFNHADSQWQLLLISFNYMSKFTCRFERNI